MDCPSCQSVNTKKNGHIHNGKQNFQCKDCGREFVADSQKKIITQDQRELIKKLLLERISLRGICRVMNVSLVWLLGFFREVTSQIPEDRGVIKPHKSKLTIELDEMWSFVGSKENKQWIWLAACRREIRYLNFYGLLRPLRSLSMSLAQPENIGLIPEMDYLSDRLLVDVLKEIEKIYISCL